MSQPADLEPRPRGRNPVVYSPNSFIPWKKTPICRATWMKHTWKKTPAGQVCRRCGAAKRGAHA